MGCLVWLLRMKISDEKHITKDGIEKKNPKRISSFIKKSKEEFKKYEETDDEDYLAQAGEKLWNVFNMMIAKHTNKSIKSFGMLRREVGMIFGKTGNRLVFDLFEDTYELHKYFYRGHADVLDEETRYKNSLYGIEILKKTWGM